MHGRATVGTGGTETLVRRVDPRSLRFGAGVTAGLLLAVGLVADLPMLVLLLGGNLLVAGLFGVMLHLPNRPWPFLRRALKVGGVPRVPELPARFSAVTQGLALLLGALAMLRGHVLGGWALVAVVAALQAAHAVTGVDVVARLFQAGGAVPDAFGRMCGRLDRMRVQAPGRGPRD
ncbi:MAG: hypothetical protein U0869_04190 [Chloroflexota bacterium]